MKSVIRKMGNSQGVILPKHLLTEVGARTDDPVDITVKKGRIVIEPIRQDPRAGWAADSKAIHDAGDDKLAWPEFPNEFDRDWEW